MISPVDKAKRTQEHLGDQNLCVGQSVDLVGTLLMALMSLQKEYVNQRRMLMIMELTQPSSPKLGERSRGRSFISPQVPDAIKLSNHLTKEPMLGLQTHQGALRL